MIFGGFSHIEAPFAMKEHSQKGGHAFGSAGFGNHQWLVVVVGRPSSRRINEPCRDRIFAALVRRSSPLNAEPFEAGSLVLLTRLGFFKI